jgi:hypothetical protein
MESTVGLRWAFSDKRQTAYATALANSALTLSHPFEGADFGEHTPNISDNAALFGKGHEFATNLYLLSWDTRFRRTCFLTSKIAGWGFAFHTGKVTTSAAAPGYQHIFEYQDPYGAGYYGSGRQLPVTTIAEQATSGLIRKFPSMLVSAIELTGNMNDFCRCAIDLIGSGAMTRLTVGGSPPAITWPTSPLGDEGERLRNTAMLFEHGPSGVSPLSDLSCDIRSWRFRSEHALAEDDGYCPGSGYLTPGEPASGQIRNKLEFLRRAVMLEWVVRASSDNTVFTRLEGMVELSAQITLTGAQIGIGPADHTVIVNVPQLKYRAVPIGSDGDVVIFSISTAVMYDDTLANPYEVTVINDQATYLTT